MSDAVVEVEIPAEGLLAEGFPADEDVERGLAGEDGLQLLLQGLRGTEAGGGTGFVGAGVVGLLADPFAEVTEGQLFEGAVVEAVVIDEDMEAVLEAVPAVPDEGAVVEEGAVLLKRLVA